MSTASPADFRPIDRSQHELLIVDDDPASRYATVRRLASAGFRTREASTGTEALAAATPALSAIVLDVHLPDIDGFALCRQLRLQPDTARIPVLHLSAAYVTDEDKVRGLDAGADAYLTRPVDPAVLVATVQALVRTRVAEEAMRRSEAKFRGIYVSAPIGICLLDDQGRFLDANPAMLRMLGREPGELVGHAVGDFVPAGDIGAARSLVFDARAGRTPVEQTLLDGGGRAVPLEWHLSAHSEGVTLAQVIDITERLDEEQRQRITIDRERDARTSAEQLNRMKDEFIAVLSHELRSPLNAMMGWTHVLIRRGAGEQVMQGLKAIERNGKAQARLINDLLDMSRLNVGKMRLARTPLDLVEVVQAAVGSLGATAEDNDNPIVVRADPTLPAIYGDAARLHQVMWNLLSNAVKFSPKHSPIEVVLAVADDGVSISVRDHGRGIAPEFLPHLFERFTQADTVNQRFRSGLGLGLSIASHLVQAHGGRLKASSDGPGKGATFDVWLPLAVPLDASSGPGQLDDAPEAALDLPFQGMRLLIVDDDPEALAMLQIILADRGATVSCARDVAGALQALESTQPDGLVCDIGLPGRDGYELIRQIRRDEGTGTRLPAVALTAFTQRKDRAQALAAGFDVHLTKPVRPLQLVQAITELVARGSVPPAAAEHGG